ncbi:aminotransferase [Galactobacter valiniphilus]|uniref:aminotransferase n=1 Tax=Galactobacter valiniphilus TaxID=2676122 RepID=UPI001F468E1C|nr:aminotransferase [Galactobacter valiniphilus]
MSTQPTTPRTPEPGAPPAAAATEASVPPPVPAVPGAVPPLDFGLKRPAVDEALAARVAQVQFGLDATATELGSNQDRNFLLAVGGANAGVLKIDNAVFEEEELDAQCRAAEALAAAGIPAARFLPGADGERLQRIEDADGVPHFARLMEYLPGGSLVDAGYLSKAALASVGDLAGRVDVALAPLAGPGLRRELQWDLRRGIDVVRRLAGAVPDDGRRQAVLDAAEGAWKAIEAQAPGLPTQPIHGDLTDDNVIGAPGPDGRPLAHAVIDLGDLAIGWRVAEIAVSVSSLLHHRPDDPLACLEAVSAYLEHLRLDEPELRALWPLVVLRAAVLIASGWEQTRLEGDNVYAAERMDGEWEIFAAATSVPLAVGTAAVLGRAGVAPSAPAAGGALYAHAPRFTVLDLGIESEELPDGAWLRPGAAQGLIEARLGPGSADAVYVHALAPRLDLTPVDSATGGASVPLGATVVHSTPRELLAPGPGIVAAPARPATPEDPTAEGKRAPEPQELLLHLDSGDRLLLRGVVRPVRPGAVSAGTVLGHAPSGSAVTVFRLGPAAPEDPARIPDAVRPAEAGAWRRLILDPAPWCGVEPLPEGRSPSEEYAARLAVQSSAQEKYYEEPMQMERGWRHHLVDTDGRSYVDLVNNVAGLGHSHPGVRDAASRQLGLLNTNSRFLYRELGEYAQRLADLAPEGLDTVLFVNSGSEAVDLALKLARAASGRPEVAALREAYHGWTAGADAVTTSAYDSPHALESLPGWVKVLDVPHPLRGAYTGDDAGARYAADAAAALAGWADTGTPVGAFICESVLGNAGGVLLPEDYLAGVYEAVRAQGGLCIADEVQVGFGRMGSHFWGFELQGVTPDLITIAKPMGNGFPIGAVITRREIAEALGREGMFFSSAGGSPLSCAVGQAVLDAMEAEDLQGNAQRVGERLRAGLQGLVAKHRLASMVHGAGLYLGLELVRDERTLEPAAAETAAICERLRELGVIVQPTSERQNVLKIKPPLCLDEASADFAVAQIDRVLSEGW